jgi:hypothetical protein
MTTRSFGMMMCGTNRFLPPALLTRAERVKGPRQNKIKNQNVKIKIVDSPLGWTKKNRNDADRFGKKQRRNKNENENAKWFYIG